jgi:murein DD-endopeptidase MepM/ murein hydrolase activator NlpD
MHEDHGDQGRQRWTGRLRRVLGVLLLVLAGGLSGLPSLWLHELGRIGRAFPEGVSRVGQAVQAHEPLGLAGQAARTAAVSAPGVVSEPETGPPVTATDGAVASEVDLNDVAADQPQAPVEDPAPAATAASELAAGPSQEEPEIPEVATAPIDEAPNVPASADADLPIVEGGSPEGVAPDVAVLAHDSLPASPADEESPEAVTLSGPRHQVAPGETLSGIAEEYRVELSTVLEANALDPSVPIMIGQELVVPGGVRIVVTPAPAKPLVVQAVATAIPAARRPAAPAAVQRPVVPTPKPVAPTPKPVPPKPQTAAAPTPARQLAARIVPASAVPAVLPGGSLIRPVGGPISQAFIPGQHNGLDIAAASGTSVRAAAPGLVVVAAKLSYGYGWRIMLDHTRGLTTLYGHLSRLDVAPGDRVAGGQVIGAVGATGQATGPHLHFEIAVEGAMVDPQRYLP